MESEAYDCIFKIIIIGNGSSGKSSLLSYYLTGKPAKNISQTVGVEFACKIIEIKGKRIKLQLWDTAGQERYRSIARTYYRGALGALVMFDLTNTESFASMQQWIKDARDFARPDICIIACGNKADMIDQRRITEQQAKQLVKETQTEQYFETSAMTGENVEQVFASLSSFLVQRMENGLIKKDELKPRLLTVSHPKDEPTNGAKEECMC